MSYTTGIPTSGQSLGNSRPQVQGNFDYINTSFAINHVAFNSGGVGKHKFLQMPEQGSAPTTAVDEGGLYSKVAQTITNLFWRQENNGTEIQMTNITPINAASGYTFLPGGFLIQWGKVTLDASGNFSVTFPSPFSLLGVNNDPWNIQLTLNTAANITQRCVYATNVAFDSFDIVSTNGQNRVVFWIAIGPKT